MDTSRNREVIANIKRGWNEDAFMRAQGLSVQEHAPGEVTICLAHPTSETCYQPSIAWTSFSASDSLPPTPTT